MIREELSRLFTIGERHRRLFARLVLAVGLSTAVFAVGTVLIWVFENGQKGGNIHGLGDAAFFCAVQLLTVSSSITNPLTTGGKIVDVGLEAWAIFVVTAVAGSFATFFSSGDASLLAARGWLWERGQATMQAAEASRAVAAAMSTAASLDLAVEDAVVLHDSNKLTVRLLPCDVLARVAPVALQVAQFEVDLAQRLAGAGLPGGRS